MRDTATQRPDTLCLARAQARRNNYKNKNVFGADELRRRREEQQVEIRKQKREESVAKRRNLTVTAGDVDDSDDDNAVAGALDSQVGRYLAALASS